MDLTHAQLIADVAAVYIGEGEEGSFGSGRLIAPGLILTAGHVVDWPSRESPQRQGWKVVLAADRKPDGSWPSEAHKAELVWHGEVELDLALLSVTDEALLRPSQPLIFCAYELAIPLGEINAVGFPDAWVVKDEPLHDYSVYGVLRIVSNRGPFAWDILPADVPDETKGWQGMSGASLCRIGDDGRLHLFGAVQQVPANFSGGKLEAARISQAFDDPKFCAILREALDTEPTLTTFTITPRRASLGIAGIFQARTQAFLKEYLVSETGPVPFGGRDEELHRLDAWLFDPKAPPRMLVTAPAGRGKSALLVQWMKNLQDGGVCGPNGWQLAFMPISIRSGSNRPEVFYEGLARRLAEITEKELPSEAIKTADGFRYAVRELLDGIGKHKILIVIDGLDEALGDSFDSAIFPTPMPSNLRVLLSARWQAGDTDSKGWLVRLGWDRDVKVGSFEIEPLAEDGIADVLVKLGAPIDILARDHNLVKRLAELTEGEPLLIKYYAEELWGETARGVRITPADLDHLKPGFDSYFQRWFENQEKVWVENNIDGEEVDKVLSLLAFAHGPLQQGDLVALMKRIHDKRAMRETG